MLEPKEVYTPKIDRIEFYFVGETLVHRILPLMPCVLGATWYPSEPGANHQTCHTRRRSAS